MQSATYKFIVMCGMVSVLWLGSVMIYNALNLKHTYENHRVDESKIRKHTH